jgi:hypothetical protein
MIYEQGISTLGPAEDWSLSTIRRAARRQILQKGASTRGSRTHFPKNCDTKVQYGTRDEANIALMERLHRVISSNMDVYRCSRHNCFHLGHARYMKPQEIVSRDRWVGFRFTQASRESKAERVPVEDSNGGASLIDLLERFLSEIEKEVRA